MLQLFNSPRVNLIIMVINLFCGMIPILAGYDFSYLNTVENNEALKSEPVQFASYALIFANIPALLDICFDIISIKKLRAKSSDDYFYGRLPIVVGTFFTSVVSFMASQSTQSSYLYQVNGTAVYRICVWIYEVITICSLLYSLCIAKPELFKVHYTAAGSIYLSITITLRLCTHGRPGLSDAIVSAFLTAGDFLYAIISLCCIKKMTAWEFKSPDERASVFYFSATVMFLISSIVWTISYWSQKDVLSGSENATVSNILLFIYTKIIWIILFTVVPSRIYQYEINEAHAKAVETKSDCTSFLVKKFRIPLQTLHFGLLILFEYMSNFNLQSQTDVSDNPFYQIENAYNILSQASNDVTAATSNFSYYVGFERGVVRPSKRRDVDTRVLIYDALTVLQAQIASKNIQVTNFFATVKGEGWVSFYGGPVLLEADSDMIHQVVLNLVSNATKYTPQNGNIKIIVCLNKTRKSEVQEDESLPIRADSVTIRIIDSGIGLSEIDQKKLFKKHVQLKPVWAEDAINSGGSASWDGLGLWVSRQIVELHDGTISVFSKGEGSGSTFTVELPTGASSSILELSSNASHSVDLNINDSISCDGSTREEHLIHVDSWSNIDKYSNSFKRLSTSSRSASLADPTQRKDISRVEAAHKPNVRSGFQIISPSSTNKYNSLLAWKSKGMSVAIECLHNSTDIELSVLNSLKDKLAALIFEPKVQITSHIMPNEPAPTLQSYYRDMHVLILNECSKGTNVVLKDYYLKYVQNARATGNQPPLDIFRPTYAFLLVQEDLFESHTKFLPVPNLMAESQSQGKSLSDASNSHYDRNRSSSESTNALNHTKLTVAAYRALGCYEIHLNSSDSTDDVVDNILAIMSLFDNDGSDDSLSYHIRGMKEISALRGEASM